MTRTYAVPREQAAYLGYPLTITQSTVRVDTPAGQPLGEFRSLVAARRRIRQHRGIGRTLERSTH